MTDITCLPRIWRNIRTISEKFFLGIGISDTNPDTILDYAPLNDIKLTFDHIE